MFENSHHNLINGGNFTHVSQRVNGSRGEQHCPSYIQLLMILLCIRDQSNWKSATEDPLQLLLDCTAPAAFHNSGERRDPPKCHPNTRVAVLEKIMKWVLGEDPTTSNYPIMWIHGPAGSGKSAIEQTIADMLFAEGRLLASYFFSRFDSKRNHSRTLIPTLVYQLATHFPDARQVIQSTLDADPLLLSRSLSAQMTALIVQPVQNLIRSGHYDSPLSRRVIVVDGLDECVDRDEQVEILRAISQPFGQHQLPLLFLIASRPEHDITYAFASEPVESLSARLALDDKYLPSEDIRLFLFDKFHEIKRNHPFRLTIPNEWPSDEVIQSLVDKSSGQFIYAATVIRFVKSIRHRPPDRLDIVRGLRPASRELPFGELDALYSQILSLMEDKEIVLGIFSCELLTRGVAGFDTQITVNDIEAIMSLQPGDVKLALCDLHSVVDIEINDEAEILHFFHASLPEFLLDKKRSKSLYIDAPLQHSKIAMKILQNDLVFNDNNNLLLHWLGWHIEHAEPSTVLLRAICDLDITRIYSFNGRKWLHLTLGIFLDHLRNSKFETAEAIYDVHFQRFYAYAARALRYYYTDPALTALTAMTLISPTSPQNPIPVYWQIEGLISEPTGTSLDLQLLDSRKNVVIQGSYARLIQQVCGDPDRPDVYFDSAKYAAAALFFAKSLSHTSFKGLSTFPAQKRLKNSPWKWRKTYRWRYKERAAHNNIGALHKQPIQRLQRSWIQSKAKAVQQRHNYAFLWSFEACLQRARPSEELSAFLTRMSFGLLAHTYIDSVKSARKVIRRYLKD